ncbi:cobalamin Fe3+-siderophores ABC transporter permease [Staphylococcus gallinarum]|uniref:Cobalamin Fe3+-siderophores ABC transporter permease n=1 Tax=Staphylococcus gallinarum TaxID=1293 RepID=A0A380FCN6_STAGA|nr:cobalamin Fe3+-siderophores ABC transporter permease [Staphylococcus gallinarum]
MIFFPQENILIKLSFAVVLSILGTFMFVKLVQFIQFKDVIFIPLLGIMLGGIVSSFSTFIALRTNAVQSIGNWFKRQFCNYNNRKV